MRMVLVQQLVELDSSLIRMGYAESVIFHVWIVMALDLISVQHVRTTENFLFLIANALMLVQMAHSEILTSAALIVIVQNWIAAQQQLVQRTGSGVL